MRALANKNTYTSHRDLRTAAFRTIFILTVPLGPPCSSFRACRRVLSCQFKLCLTLVPWQVRQRGWVSFRHGNRGSVCIQ